MTKKFSTIHHKSPIEACYQGSLFVAKLVDGL